jgi:hypothetical protein
MLRSSAFRDGIAKIFAVGGVATVFWPLSLGGYPASEARIIGTILIVGAAILWFMPGSGRGDPK